jgi:competence protein ComEC
MDRSAPAVPLFCAAVAGALVGVALAPSVLFIGVLALLALVFAWRTRAAAVQAAFLLALPALLACMSASMTRGQHGARSAALPHALAVFEGIAGDVASTRMGSTRVRLEVTGVLEGDEPAAPRALVATLDVFLPSGADPVRPGDRVRVRGAARPPAPADLPGEIDGALLALARGVDARVSVHAPGDLAVMERGAKPRPFATARARLSERIQALSTEREAGLLLALLIGDTALLTEEQRALYRDVGAGHLLAVSGLQVSLLALLLRALFIPLLLLMPGGRSGRAPRLAGALAIGCVWGFVFLCSAPPSALRAGAMASAVLVAELVGRRARALDAIGVAGLLTVLASPVSVVDPSFLLSYGAVIGLALAPRAEPGEEATLLSSLRAGILATLAAGLMTLPISAFLFGQVSLGGMIANVVLVPAASLLQVPALSFGAIGALSSSAGLVWLGAQAALLLEALVAGLDALLGGTQFLSAPPAWVAGALALAAAGVLAAFSRRRITVALAVGAAALALVGVVQREPYGVRILVIPIGQGDATLFELPNGTNLLVDGGGTLLGADPGEALLVPFLRREGIERIDVMVLSHPHPDHGNGLVAVARAFEVGELWHSGAPDSAPILAPLLAALSPTTRVRATPELLGEHRLGDVNVQVLAPAPTERTPRYPELGENDNSLVLRVCLGETCALWPGDVEALGEGLLLESTPPEALRAQLVKAAHHGSSTSSTEAFVRATGARHVVFCTGRDNAFFFPHGDVIERWQAAGARTWDTAVHGLLRATLGPNGVQIHGLHDGTVTAPPGG